MSVNRQDDAMAIDGAPDENRNEVSHAELMATLFDAPESLCSALESRCVPVEILDELGPDGRTLLMHAMSVQPSLVPTLVAAGANVDACGREGQTALSEALGSAPDVVPVLIGLGADVNKPVPRIDHWSGSSHGEFATPLMLAVCSPRALELVTLLLASGADPRTVTPDGDTVLLSCLREARSGSTTKAERRSQAERLRITKVLVDAGSCVNATRVRSGHTVLMSAIRHLPCALPLLVRAGAMLTATKKIGIGVLGLAIDNAPWTGPSRWIGFLLKAGADINEGTGRHALSVLAAGHSMDMLQFVLAAGAPILPLEQALDAEPCTLSRRAKANCSLLRARQMSASLPPPRALERPRF